MSEVKKWVTSQRVIENAWDQAKMPEGSKVDAEIVLRINELNIKHTVNGKIGSWAQLPKVYSYFGKEYVQ